jgi:hypothetical protein
MGRQLHARKDDAAAKSQVKAMTFDHLLYRHWNSYVVGRSEAMCWS